MLTDNTISLRAPEPDDLDAIYRWENDADNWISASTTAPLSRHQIWQFIQDYDGDIFASRQLRMIIVENETGEAIGTVDLTGFEPADRRAWTGIYITPEKRGKGYGERALVLLCDYASNTIGLHQLVAVTLADNKVSRALFQAAGFRSCGLLRSWVRIGRSYCDGIIWQRLFEI